MNASRAVSARRNSPGGASSTFNNSRAVARAFSRFFVSVGQVYLVAVFERELTYRDVSREVASQLLQDSAEHLRE